MIENDNGTLWWPDLCGNASVQDAFWVKCVSVMKLYNSIYCNIHTSYINNVHYMYTQLLVPSIGELTSFRSPERLLLPIQLKM